MIISAQERHLCRSLRDLPKTFRNRFDKDANRALQQILFRSLVNDNDDYLTVLFKEKVPRGNSDWSLKQAQGAVDGSEYTEAARGKACGHIFKGGEATYRCKTCTSDDTCVLCSKCFEASDHTDHMVYVSISPGNSGCCDCGDAEAWLLPVNCAIHTSENSTSDGSGGGSPKLPESLVESIRMTIGRALDYLCDVISCSPEQLRLHKSEETIREDERTSRLKSKWYEHGDEVETNPEFALILWNDEKHTVHEVENQVARACKEAMKFGLDKARETDDIGRSVITYSRDPKALLRVANIIENIRITVTIRSARDTFREQMCSTIIEWLLDISGCSVGHDHNILKQSVCREMLKLWRTGSGATNAEVGKEGIDDHETEEADERSEMGVRGFLRRVNGDGTRPPVLLADGENVVGALLTIGPENDDNEDGDDEAESQNPDADTEDPMELDLDPDTSDQDGDLDMRTAGEPDDSLEYSEAALAGYPPPPPPPPPPAPPQPANFGTNRQTHQYSDNEDTLMFQTTPRPNIPIPKTPTAHTRQIYKAPPKYWLEGPSWESGSVPLAEDIRQRVRLDWMILFDLRLWKKARVDLRDLYISTVVTVPEFKRVLGIRFAGLYTVLAQLYLIADREPDHSIIYLSLQMLTTPSITEEIVEKGNFLTNLIAILYTFLTTRQVGHPWEVSTAATLAFDAGSVTNRRMYHFFMDLKHLFASEYVQKKLREEERYVLQFLDLIRLPQGICPNVRAVGDHVEYETDAWISASLLTREINKLCRQFAESFKWRRGEDMTTISKVLRIIGSATIANSVGADRKRFDQAEVKDEMRFKQITGFDGELNPVDIDVGSEKLNWVVDFVVEKEPISFHHALHYTLSWLIDGAKSMTAGQLRRLLEFRLVDLQDLNSYQASMPDLDPETYLVALFDYPLRVCAWLAQEKARMWVRNGLSLRHQMSTYRGVSQRDLGHHRDIFLLQAALVLCNPSRILMGMMDRFGVDDWMKGTYSIRPGYEDAQLLDVAEDFIHLIIVLLSDRTSLQPLEDEPCPQSLAIRRDIAHILCFKPLSFSDLCSRLADKFQDLEEFQDILDEMTNFRAPEGLSDTGTFELKQEYLAEIDPYIAHYTKNQRDEAEAAYKNWVAKETRKPVSEVVFEPRYREIKSGLFEDLSAFTRTSLFCKIIFNALHYGLCAPDATPNIPTTRVEAYLHVVLHLVLAAILEDPTEEDDMTAESFHSFGHKMLHQNVQPRITVLLILQVLSEKDEFKSCHTKIRQILLRVKQKRPRSYATFIAAQGIPMDRLGSDSPMRLPAEDLEIKKKQALDRQAKVMAQFQKQQQDFLTSQGNIDWGAEDYDDNESVATGLTDEHKQMWKYPTGNCILCQEETNDTRLFGTFALMTPSLILRQTDLEDNDFVEEVLTTPISLDRSADDIRPFGIGSKNRTKVRKLASDGHEVISERQGLGKGFPLSHCVQGPVSTGCGHIMHYSCFDLYYSATQRRQNHQIARNHPERLDHKEFVCPLCKALGNTFLPIIWRGKEETYPGVLQVEQGWDEWISTTMPLIVTRYHKHAIGEDRKSVSLRQYERFMGYASQTMIASIASRLPHFGISGHSSPTSPPQSGRSRIPGLLSEDEAGAQLAYIQQVEDTRPSILEMLMFTYSRVRETIVKNGLYSRFAYPQTGSSTHEELTYTDALARTFAFSISATEIAQRGVQSEPGALLLDKIPPLTLTHLKILSETASSYIAVGGVRNGVNYKVNNEFYDIHNKQMMQLFCGHPTIYTNEDYPWMKTSVPVTPALAEDSFLLLAECSVYLVPALNLDIHHVLRVCYLLELVKIVFATNCSRTFPARSCSVPVLPTKECDSPEAMGYLSSFIGRINEATNPNEPPMNPNTLSLEILDRLYAALSTYALVFLRKAVILLHVRYGVDFPNTGFSDMDDSELDRLTRALGLPTLGEMFQSTAKGEEGSNSNSKFLMMRGWVQHWLWMHNIDSMQRAALVGLRPSHPAIFELIGLPKYYDTLLDEMMRRRCPSTGKELTEPALCLFCGAIFCSQAFCCSKDGLGGCSQHLMK